MASENRELQHLFNHRSVRNFDPNFVIPQKDIETIIRAGQAASTSCTGQMYTIISIPKGEREQYCGNQGFIEQSSFFGIICVDLYRLHRLVESAGAENPKWPMAGLLIGTFDAGLFGQNIMLAAQAMGYQGVFCGSCGDKPDVIIERLGLPEHVFPLTGIALGRGIESPPTRPRIPSRLVLHNNGYMKYTKEDLEEAIDVMNKGLEEEGYYRKYSKRENYFWKDHLKRKFGGKWLEKIDELRMRYLKRQKFLDDDSSDFINKGVVD